MSDFAIVRPKKNIELFLRPFFLKTDAAGRGFIFIFIQQKTDAGTFFFLKKTQTRWFLKLCFDGYFIRYYSIQAIKLDSNRVDLASLPIHKTYTVGA